MILNNNKKKEGIKLMKKMCYENRYNRAKSRIIRAEFIYLIDFNELSHYHKENRYSESVQLHITTNNQV